MKKLRVFQTVKMRRIVPEFSLKNLGTVLLFLLFVPYLITSILGNTAKADPLSENGIRKIEEGTAFVCNVSDLGNEKIPLEIYVADKLARSIDCNYEPEALKAQAILIRSGVLAAGEDYRQEAEITLRDEDYGKGTITDKILQAVSQTAGVYLAYDSRPVSGAYFEVSNGQTRNGEELGDGEYCYLQSVPCERDFLSENYANHYSFQEQEFELIWEQLPKSDALEESDLKGEGITEEKVSENMNLYRDSAGYVIYVEREGEYTTGEQFRVSFHISSACFQMQKDNGQILISTRGSGHGLGMSQFGANEMAKAGDDYIEILKYFFKDVTITKFE